MEDKLIRAMTDAGAFRVLGVVCTEAVKDAREAHGLNEEETRALGRCIAGGLLIRSTLHPNERLQVKMNHNGRVGDLSVDILPEGLVRARILGDLKADRTLPSVGDVGFLEVARTRGRSGAVHQSMTLVITGTVQDELQLFLLESEQIASAIVLEVSLDESGEIRWAGGVLVQLLPEAENQDLAKIVPKLEKVLCGLLDEGLPGPEILIANVIPKEMPYTQLAEEKFEFGCNCSETRVLSALTTLPQDEVRDILEKQEVLELSCGFCGETYQVHSERLRSVIEEN